MKKLYLLGIVLLSWQFSEAQSPEELERWVRSVESEYPGIDQPEKYSQIKSNHWDFDRIRYNLMADKYFVPLMGSRFDDLPTAKQGKFLKSVEKLVEKNKRKANSGQEAWIFRLSDYMSTSFSSLKGQAVRLREARQEYAKFMARLDADFMALESVNELVRMAGSKFDLLMPSEIQALNTGVLNKRDKLVSKQIETQWETINKSYKRFELLDQLSRFQQKFKDGFDYEKLVKYLSAESKARFVARAEDRYNTESANILNQASEIIKTGDIDKITPGAWEIESNKEKFKEQNRLAKYLESLREFKLRYVRDHRLQIENEIKSSKDVDSLWAMRHKYFSGTKQGNEPQLTSLIKLVDDRREKLQNAIWQREETAKQQKVQQLLQAEKKAMAANGLKFTTEGLDNPELAKKIMMGNFLNIRFSREDAIAADIINEYITAYSKMCRDFLPKNKVQIYEEVCALEEEEITRNGLGLVINTVKRCVSYKSVPTGIFVRPELFDVRRVVNGLLHSQVAGNMLKDLASGQYGSAYTLSQAVDAVVRKVTDTKDPDMFILVQKNGCTGSGLKRFEENLIRFAMDKPPIQLVKTEMNYTSEEQNLKILTEDLIIESTPTWMEYDIGHVHNSLQVDIIEKDEKGRPKKVLAIYSGHGRGDKNKMVLEFNDGVPKCLYYEERSSNCFPPNKKIIADFINGKYKKIK